MAKLISKTYGEALFDLGVEKGTIDALFEEGKAVLEAVANTDDLIKFLNNPQIDGSEKLTVVKNIFSKFVSDDLTGFIVTIVEKGRQSSLVEIFEYFVAKVKEYKHIGVVYVTTPLPLGENEKDAVVKKLLSITDYVSLEMNYSIDESLIGGMVIRIGDRVVDSSIKNKLNGLTKELLSVQLA